MQSSHHGDYFQTSSSLDNSRRKREKSQNQNGKPIKLSSKIIAIEADPHRSNSVYLAEGSGILRRLDLEVGETTAIYRGPTAPLTSLCFSPDGKVIFAGCWDKTIWSWDVQSRAPQHRYSGHKDFVKAIVCVRSGKQDFLISGGADTEIIIWNAKDGTRLHIMKDHTRGVQHLVVDPIIDDDEPLSIFSAGSDRSIRYFGLPVTGGTPVSSGPIIEHETSVYKLLFDDDGDLWTASADKTARCLTRERGWKSELSLEHPDFVKDVVVDEMRGWVITACRDEEVRIWNRASGELYHTYSGHFEEVTGLLLLGSRVISVSIDGTLRQWSLDPTELDRAKTEKEEGICQNVDEPVTKSILTEEEERELDDLLLSDD